MSKIVLFTATFGLSFLGALFSVSCNNRANPATAIPPPLAPSQTATITPTGTVTNTPTATIPPLTYVSQWAGNDNFATSYMDRTVDHIYEAYHRQGPITYPAAIYTTSGTLLNPIGTYSTGGGAGYFYSSLGVATDGQGNIWVSDSNFNYIQQFYNNGTTISYVKTFGTTGSGNGQFQGVQELEVDGKGDIYAADLNNYRIQKLDHNGNMLWQYGVGNGAIVTGLFYANGYLYFTTANALSEQIVKLQDLGSSVGTATHYGTFGTGGAGSGQLFDVQGIDGGPDGSFYISNYLGGGNAVLCKYDSNFNFITSVDGSASGAAFYWITSVISDSAGFVYVRDGASNDLSCRVVKFTP
jgi:hypothetical protein